MHNAYDINYRLLIFNRLIKNRVFLVDIIAIEFVYSFCNMYYARYLYQIFYTEITYNLCNVTEKKRTFFRR